MNTLSEVGWKFTAFELTEQGRRDLISLGALERAACKPVKPIVYKVIAAAITAGLGVYYSPAWAITPFLCLSAWKDIHVSAKTLRLINVIRAAKLRVFMVHETMCNVRHQSLLLMTSNRSEVTQLSAKLLMQWGLFHHLVEAMSPVCTKELVAELNRQKEAVVISLEALRLASKGKKSQKQFDAALKTAQKALKTLTEPQEPRGILTQIYIRAESAVAHAQQALKTYLAPSFE